MPVFVLTPVRGFTASTSLMSCSSRCEHKPPGASRERRLHLLRVVKDHANRMAFAGTEAADAVAQVDAIKSAAALDRTVMHRKRHGVALTQGHHLGARLHARALLGQHEFAAREIAPGLG